MVGVAAPCRVVFGCSTPVAADDPLAGEWTLTISTPRGIQHPTLTVVLGDAGYSGTYRGRRGSQSIERIELDGNRFSFPLTLSIPIGDIDVHYAGTVAGDEMTGAVQNPRGQVPFSGVRKR